MSKKYVQNGTFGFIYFLTVIGAAVFYIQQASGFWGVVLGFLKSWVWPAFMTYRLFQYFSA